MHAIKPFLLGAALSFCLAMPAVANAQLPWRSVSAPPDREELLAFVTAPADSEDNPVEPPIGKQEPKGKGNDNPPPQQQPSNTPNPFERPDTTKAGGFHEAPLETLGPGMINRNYGGSAATLPVASHARRGIFGIHPLAILVALVALHVFVVTSVVK